MSKLLQTSGLVAFSLVGLGHMTHCYAGKVMLENVFITLSTMQENAPDSYLNK